jgi:RNA polymerase sigma factor (sigma-70 family)
VPKPIYYTDRLTAESPAKVGEEKTLVFHPSYLDESTLWKAFKAGDEKALVSIFDRFAKILFNYGFKIYHESEVVKDTVQELFIELWKNKKNLSDTDSIKFYLFKSLRRKLHRVKKTQIDKEFLQLTEGNDATAPSHEFFVIAEQTSLERRQKLMKMLDSITVRQREAIFLRYFEEMSYENIAAIMEMSRQSVYNLIHKGLTQLRELN